MRSVLPVLLALRPRSLSYCFSAASCRWKRTNREPPTHSRVVWSMELDSWAAVFRTSLHILLVTHFLTRTLDFLSTRSRTTTRPCGWNQHLS